MPRSPVFRAVVGPLSPSDGQREVSVVLAGHPLHWCKVTVDEQSTGHRVRYNDPAGEWYPETGTKEWEYDRRGEPHDQFDLWKVYVTAGANASTFTIVGIP